MEDCERNILVVLNPKGGNSNADQIRTEFARWFPADTCLTTIYETAADDKVSEVVRGYNPSSFTMVVAVGGDGTVSDVAEALIGSEVPLGVVPAGTGNVLARDLGIPLDIPAAIELLASDHATTKIDAMRVNNRYYVVSIGCGIDSLMVRDTPRAAKRRWGRLAYFLTIVRSMIGYEGHAYTIVADGQRYRRRAMQILVANTAAVGADPLSWGDHIRPNDGVIDICILNARTVREILGVIWSAVRRTQKQERHLQYLTARRSVTLSTSAPQPVQADGELLGQTPIQIQIVPQALVVIVPPVSVVEGVNNVPEQTGEHAAIV